MKAAEVYAEIKDDRMDVFIAVMKEMSEKMGQEWTKELIYNVSKACSRFYDRFLEGEDLSLEQVELKITQREPLSYAIALFPKDKFDETIKALTPEQKDKYDELLYEYRGSFGSDIAKYVEQVGQLIE